jgi:hypothetical protein
MKNCKMINNIDIEKIIYNSTTPITDDILIEEGFEKFEDVDDGEEYFYYTKEVTKEICLISNTNLESDNKYTIFIFEYNLPVCKTYSDLILLTSLLTKYENI